MRLTSTTLADAMSRFASGVTVVTGLDGQGKAHGYTATAFSSVSFEPPLLLTCLSRTATCFPVFSAARSFCVNVLSQTDEPYAMHFSAKMEDKFRHHEFTDGYQGIPVIDTALAVLGCDVEDIHEAGDHVILLGQVKTISVREGTPLLYYSRRFHGLAG